MEQHGNAEREVRGLIARIASIDPRKIDLADDLVNHLGICEDDLEDLLIEYCRRFNVDGKGLYVKCGESLNEGGGISVTGLLTLFGLAEPDRSISVGDLVVLAGGKAGGEECERGFEDWGDDTGRAR
jgi:hypothetical protein